MKEALERGSGTDKFNNYETHFFKALKKLGYDTYALFHKSKPETFPGEFTKE